jgi:hypothetical protein
MHNPSRRLLALTTATAALALPLALTSTASAAQPIDVGDCSNPSAFESAYTGLFVTADWLGSGAWYEGILRARSPEVGAWQVFQTCKFYFNGGYSLGLYSDATHLWATWINGHFQTISGCVCGSQQLLNDYAGYYPYSGYLYAGSGALEAPDTYYVGWLFQ